MSFVYMASGLDLINKNWTKIGDETNHSERFQTYKTSFPLHNLAPYIIIECIEIDNRKVQDIILESLSEFSTTKLDDYADGGIEWINKKLTLSDVKQILEDNNIIDNCNIIYGKELDQFLEESKRKKRIYNNKKLAERKKIYEEHRASLVKKLDEFPYTLRGYQPIKYNIIKNIIEQKINKRQFHLIVQLNIMCRCGKTILFQKIAYDYFKIFNIVIYVCPRLTLIENMISRWNMVFPTVKFAEVSSSNSYYCITDQQLKQLCCNKNKKTILFVCNKSFIRLKPLLQNNMKKMFIFDEAHHLVSKKTDTHPLVLLEKNKGSCLKVFSTATPVIGNYITDNKIIYMNDPKYFGPANNIVSYNDIEDAIENKFMSPASIIVGTYETDCKQSDEYGIRRIKSIKMLWELLNNKKIKYTPSKILMYANSIKSVDAMYILLKNDNRFTNMDIFQMTSNQSTNVNIKHLNSFKNSQKISILINCQMVTDGIDIQKLDTVVFIDPRYNKSDLIQIISRPRSYYVNKIAYILIPQVVDYINEDSSYDTVINIIEQLHINNDPTVVKYFKQISQEDNNNISKLSIPQEYKIVIDEKIKNKILELTKERLLKKPLSLPNAIIKLLSDNNPRSAKQICDEIKEVKLYRCREACRDLLRQGQIGRQKVNKTHIYFNIQIQRCLLSMGEFVKHIRSMDIETESQYREMFQEYYNNDLPEFPSDIYKNFSWSLLNNGTKYTLDECKAAIQNLETHVLKLIKNKYNTDQKVNKILNHLDNMIPADIKKEYGVEPNIINKKLFESFNDF